MIWQPRAQTVLTIVFIVLGLAVEGLVLGQWSTRLEPRLEAEAQLQAKLLAQGQVPVLVGAVSSGDRARLTEVLDQLLLLTEPDGDRFFYRLAVDVDETVIDLPDGAMDLERGESGDSSVVVQLLLYDPTSAELLGLAEIEVNTERHRRLAEELSAQVQIQAGLVLLMLIGVWWVALAMLNSLERQRLARARVELALAAQEQKFKRLLDELGSYFIYSRDDQGAFDFVSDSVHQVLGIDAQDFPSSFAKLLTNDQINDEFVDRLLLPPAESGAGTLEVEVRDRAGEIHRLELSELPVSDPSGKAFGIDGIARDVTAQHRFEAELRAAKEAAEAANLAKSQFLANVSHEIRTPMNAVLGMTTLALRTELDERQRNYLDTIRTSGRLLLGVINDILDLSRIEAGRMQLHTRDFRLDEVFTDLSRVVGGKAREMKLEVLFDIGDEVPRGLHGDPIRLQQVLVNLVNNAIKFTEKGEIIVTVHVVAEAEPTTLHFEVRDTGVGIDPKDLPRLFEAFTQVDESPTRRHGGTGLGLAICKRLVALMGGQIDASSKPGVGSTFAFTARFQVTEITTSADRPTSIGDLNILVVDDNPTAREIFRQMLGSHGFSVEVAASGEAALEAIEQAAESTRPFGLVVMDWRMPGLDGLEATRRIKSNNRSEAVPAVVLATAFNSDDLLELADEAGVDVIISKPASQSTLYNAVLEALEGRSPLSHPLESGTDNFRLVFEGRPVILLVEDNEVNRRVAKGLLEDLGIEVREAVDGLRAIEAITAARPDLVLMDVQMPVLDGLDATRRIRNDPALSALPIIALTAHAMDGDKQRFLHAGMNDYLSKPIEEKTLIRVLARWLKHPLRPAVSEVRESQLELGRLPGIDTDSALRRLRGDLPLLVELAESFINRATPILATIPSDLDSGLIDRVVDQAHTLKGAAGNISATRVATAARALELRLRGGADVDPSAELAELDTSLEELAASVATLQATIQPSSQQETTPVERAELLRIGDRLDQLLSERSLDALEPATAFVRSLGSHNVGLALDLQRHVEDLDFDAARDELARLLKAIDDQTPEEAE